MLPVFSDLQMNLPRPQMTCCSTNNKDPLLACMHKHPNEPFKAIITTNVTFNLAAAGDLLVNIIFWSVWEKSLNCMFLISEYQKPCNWSYLYALGLILKAILQTSLVVYRIYFKLQWLDSCPVFHYTQY